jgi:hypothetical protein
VLKVRDEGVGIAPEQLHAVFDIFTQIDATLDRSQGGLGIGLALVRRLVQMHGGSVSADSGGPGCGATFTIRLPALPAEPSDAPPARADSASRQRRGERTTGAGGRRQRRCGRHAGGAARAARAHGACGLWR